MRKFGIVYNQYFLWAQKNGISAAANHIGLFMLICEHGNLLGCYRMPPSYVAEDLGYTIDEVGKAYQELCDTGFLKYCEATKIVFMPKYLKWNPPKNINHAKGAIKIAKDLPDYFEFGKLVVESLKKYGSGFLKQEEIDNPDFDSNRHIPVHSTT